MSWNLPANRLLKLTKGRWSDVQYPVEAVVQANLRPHDYFGPVEPTVARSCVPVGGESFSYLLDANSGRMVLRGKTMFPPLSVTFAINDDLWNVIFVGRLMQVSQTINSEKDVDSLLSHFEYTLPSMLSLTTGLAIYPETLEIALGDYLEARAETSIPPNSIRIVEEDQRLAELKHGIELLGYALPSVRFTLSCDYLREALLFDSDYNDHNPYTHSLLVILKCAQAIEILFSGQRDAIRKHCRLLGIPEDVIESELIPIVLARSSLGTAHASAFVPREVDVLREFSKRSIHNIRQLLLQITHADLQQRAFLYNSVETDHKQEKLIKVLRDSMTRPVWSVSGEVAIRHVVIPDPRLPQVNDGGRG